MQLLSDKKGGPADSPALAQQQVVKQAVTEEGFTVPQLRAFWDLIEDRTNKESLPSALMKTVRESATRHRRDSHID